ncbi:uncharacterized protein LOC143287337 [Babylonia areolata]|uniref:uncharacterized protein LOC143287337 n=1 Tax=Babylonia areolata TaxID=304850 RepID=UPI003FD0BEBD
MFIRRRAFCLVLASVAVCQLVLAVLYLTRSSGYTFRASDSTARAVDSDSRQQVGDGVPQVPLTPVLNQSTNTLMQLYARRYSKMTVKAEHLPTKACPAVFHNGSPACWMPGCNASFPPLPQRLQRVLQTQHPITEEQKSVIHNMAHHPDPVDVAFVTAASANHFGESQGLIKSLEKLVFPEMRRQGQWTFRLFYYDLGLEKGQLNKLKKFCNCTVLPFPFSRLPPSFQKLRTCIWKPLVIKAHLSSSRFTVWMDASTRLTTSNISDILHQADQLGIFAVRNNYMTMMHVHPFMTSYFQIEPCYLASLYETAGGFLAFNNDVFVHTAILDPWVACAFSPRCLCPTNGTENCESLVHCENRGRGYFRCHRFDQSGLGIILVLLFDRKVTHMTHRLHHNTKSPWFTFRRDDQVKYFP